MLLRPRRLRDVVTIEELEGPQWPDPGPSWTRLIRRCHELRRVPLQEFTTEYLRLMLGQRIAVPILLPMAIDELAENPLVQGDMYPGDLLLAVLRLPLGSWHGLEQLRPRLADAVSIVAGREDLAPMLRDEVRAFAWH